jgi:RNA polymerase sigma factor (sigma-70 family)
MCIGELWEDPDDYFYLKYWGPIFAFVSSRLQHPQDAEDVTMQVLERVYQVIKRRIRTGDERKLNLKPWLFKIALNECISFQERFHQPCESLDDLGVGALYENMPSGQDISAKERAEMVESSREMSIMLFKLSDSERDVLALHYFFEMSCTEIAEALTMKPNTVKGHLRRGRKRLNELIKKRFHQSGESLDDPDVEY